MTLGMPLLFYILYAVMIYKSHRLGGTDFRATCSLPSARDRRPARHLDHRHRNAEHDRTRAGGRGAARVPRLASRGSGAGGGAASSDIALKLRLSEGTVRNYLSEAISKLGAGNRVEAARIARSRGWL